MLQLRFKPGIINETSRDLDGVLVTLADIQVVKQAPVEWNMPKVYLTFTPGGKQVIAFADELFIEPLTPPAF